MFIKEWGPILELPVRGAPTIKPNIDENGCADWGAFHTWDFERVSPKFDKVGYKLDRLREELHDAGIMISIIRRHVPRDKMNKTLELVGIGHLATADIADEDLRGLARFHLRARRILKEIERIQAQRRRRKEREVAAMLARWE